MAAGPLWLIVTALREPPRSLGWSVVGSVLIAEAVLTIVFGAIIGGRGQWLDVVVTAAAGTVALLVVYVAAMLAQPTVDGNEDQAAAAGMIIFGLPAYAALVALIAAGATCRRLWQRRDSTAQPLSPGS